MKGELLELERHKEHSVTGSESTSGWVVRISVTTFAKVQFPVESLPAVEAVQTRISRGFKPSDRLAEIANRLNAYSELRVTHPDIFMFTRYLEALNLVITETGTVHELDALIASQWSMPGGCAPGAVIKDRLTAMFPSTPQRSRAKSSSQRANAQPESRSVTPEKETGKGRPKARPAEFAVAPERHRAVRKNPKLAEVDEPAIPADMAEEIAAQPTRLAKRRDTMLIEFKENRDDMEAEEVLSLANTSSLQSSAVLSDGIQKAITILEEALEFMRPSPIYPYNRMTATLLQLLTGTRGHGFDDASIQRKLAELSAACVSGKLQHLSLAYYNRLIPASKPAVQEEMIRRAEYLTFHPGSSVLNNKLLPSGWVVCSICCATQLTLPVRASSKPKILHLMVTRWEHGVEPITLQVTTKDRFQAATLENLADILQRANENQTNHATIRAYWATRLHLNQETMDLTDSMEKLLGFAKALLLSPLLDGKDKKTKANLDTLKAVVKRDKLDVPDSILRLLVTAGGTLTTEQLIPLTSSLIKEPERSAPVVSLVTAMTKFLPNPAAARAPLILVLDNDMYGLPWESIPILRNQPVSRLPSIQFVNLHLEEHRRNELLKLNKVFYIVNPDRDLMNAQNNFHNFLGKFELKESWNGVSGMAPSSDQVKSAFEDHELILYTGHGSGSHIFNLSFFDSCRTSASMFLVGCSSVRLESSISMDGSGFLHQALMMGSPYVTGNLWSVTSACMDAFMGFILETILRKKESGKLDATDNCFLRLLATTRDRISSNYLVGAAPVFVGLPVTY
ncbi:putative Separin [Hypsibius exemplaris]|uniref:separase n=1 Tax=Hypsibius exemplaris TaxID=2072580 RepID=A0A9X6RJV0_HYPEX|nr:putative Separin [Hypsibius exemplaris]